MVLDARAMEWASANGIDTAKLKAAKVPIFGKWYFPDLPADEPLVNLQTGEIQTFPRGMRAGEVLYVPRAALRQARLGPYAALPEGEPEPGEPATTIRVQPAAQAETEVQVLPWTDKPLAPGEAIHLPSPSIFPLVLGIGISIMLLALIVASGLPAEVMWTARAIVLVLGFIYVLAGSIGWVLENHRAGVEHEHEVEHEHATTH